MTEDEADRSLDPRDRLARADDQGLLKLNGEGARERVFALARTAIQRWRASQEQLECEWPFTGDYRPIVDPEFTLDREDRNVVEVYRPTSLHYGQAHIAACYISWERSTKTQSVPNPYEPLIAIWEGGGGFRREGNLWELSGVEGPCGGLAWPAPPLHSTEIISHPAPPPHLAGKFTPEQSAEGQALAEKLKRFSTDGHGRSLAPLARQARLIIVLVIAGGGFLLAGVTSLLGRIEVNTGTLAQGADSGGAINRLGPHAGAWLMVLIGVVVLSIGMRLLAKGVAAAKAARQTSAS